MEYGSDVVVALLEAYGIDHVAFAPGASFRGIHDSLVHRPDAPRVVPATTEGLAVAIGHGYAKAAGRPMAVALHDLVGLQQASMAIFNAWCDRVPLLLLGGTGPVEKSRRRPWIDWIHTALVQGNAVRDYVKWDDQPASVADVPESFHRAFGTAVSAPPGPVYVCYDVALQEDPLAEPLPAVALTPHSPPTDPAPSAADIAWIAERCRSARLPVLVTDYAGDTDDGFHALVALAEALEAPVVDRGARFSFPTRHRLNASQFPEILAEADVVLAIDVENLTGALATGALAGDGAGLCLRDGVEVVHVTPAHYKLRAWAQDYQRLLPLTRTVSAAPGPALAALLDAVKGTVPSAVLHARAAHVGTRGEDLRRGHEAAAASAEGIGGIAPARLAAELGALLAEDRWVLVNGSVEGWERRLWDFERPRQHLGWHGGAGLGYGLGASIGGALALDGETIAIDLQSDGDFLFTSSGLWTLAHLALPLLVVMVNNRQYRNSVDHAEVIGRQRRERSDTRTGNVLTDPAVDYAALAGAYGIFARGPVEDPAALAEALGAALDVVRSGRPALVDVVVAGS